MNSNKYTFGVGIMMMALILSACSAVAPQPADNVTVQLSWFHGVEYAGFYAAVEKGYYAEENINVVLNAGGPEINPFDEVASGNAQFGIGSSDSIILAKADGKNFVSVATIYRDNPLAITSLVSDNIQKPEDLVGKTIGTYSIDLSNYWDLMFLAFMSRTGLERDSMKYAVIEDFSGANEIKSGNMDAMSGMFATDQQVMTRQAGDEINLMYYKDYGVQVYINTIFVTDEYKNNNSDLITRFLRATFRGYQYALENTDEMASVAVSYDETLDLEYQKQVMVASIPFIDTGNAPIGSMDEGVWNITQDILLEFDLLSAPVDLSTVYTNEFILP
ncbi:MAG: NMT1/THI5-like domain-containing protein [Chloroflexi bacterium OLB14]|nr:MAG: NMT1/THI5-like domain-containing protein [Chloroflexi bacterium OLB14]